MDSFNELLRISNPKEIEVYDQILASKGEFGFFVGAPENVVANESKVAFKKLTKVKGLHWMTALARVELGAMLSGFTDLENPFQEVPPTRFDLAEYTTLLNEGWASHIFGISQIAKGVIKRLPQASPHRNKMVIKNARRSKLCAEMISYSAAAKLYQAEQSKNNETDQTDAIKSIAQLQLAYDQLQDYRKDLGKELLSQIQTGGLQTQTQQYVSTQYDSGIKAYYPKAVRQCARIEMEKAIARSAFTLTPIN